MRSLLVLAVASAAVLLPAGPSQKASVSTAPAIDSTTQAAPVRPRHRPPVDVPLVDVFRPPASPYGPGNRGVDYATAEGSAVWASADGTVVFAGPVGGRLHVVIRHDDGIRTSYSFLAAIGVRRGQRVSAAAEVGKAGPSLHFGARRGDAYIDPLTLFDPAGEARVHLVADEPDEPNQPGQPEQPDRPGYRAARTPPPSPVTRATTNWARRARP